LVAVLFEQRVGLGDRPVVQRHRVAVMGEIPGDVRPHDRHAGDTDLCGRGLRRTHVCASQVGELLPKLRSHCGTANWPPPAGIRTPARYTLNSRCSSVNHGTTSAIVGTTMMAAAARYAVADSARLLPRPDSRRTRTTVLAPPTASAPDGARPDAQATSARARGVRPVARTAASSATSST